MEIGDQILIYEDKQYRSCIPAKVLNVSRHAIRVSYKIPKCNGGFTSWCHIRSDTNPYRENEIYPFYIER